MQKIPTVFLRDDANRKHVLPQVHPACGWVLKGEGVGTRKYDGTCTMLDETGRWWARREVKPGKAIPAGFQCVDVDAKTGKSVGWEPVEQSGFAKWHADALDTHAAADRVVALTPGTYELCGPKINGNPERFETHVLVPHAAAMTLRSIVDLTTPEALRDFVLWAGSEGYEGVVWHHPDGRMAKLKCRDFPS